LLYQMIIAIFISTSRGHSIAHQYSHQEYHQTTIHYAHVMNSEKNLL